jgi:hypothetical protein
MNNVLIAFGPLDFTMLLPVLTLRAFCNVRTVYFFNFPFFKTAVKKEIWNLGCLISEYGGTPDIFIYLFDEKFLENMGIDPSNS